MLDRDTILGLSDTPLKPEVVVTPFGTVCVPRLTAGGMSKFLDTLNEETKGAELASILVDEHGTRLFTSADAERLDRVPAAFSVAVTRAFREANGLVPKASASTADSPTG